MSPNPMTYSAPPPEVADGYDLSGITGGGEASGFENGWYQGVILASRSFTSRDGSTRVYTSRDTLSKNGDSRNIRLEVEIVRASDARLLNLTLLVNYRMEDLTPETIKAVKEGIETDTRTRIGLQRLAQLQRIGASGPLGVAEEGGLTLTQLYGKRAHFRLGPDDRNPDYKAIKAFQIEAPKRAPVL